MSNRDQSPMSELYEAATDVAMAVIRVKAKMLRGDAKAWADANASSAGMSPDWQRVVGMLATAHSEAASVFEAWVIKIEALHK